ncbi:MAG: hypothetical protein KJO69_10175 [Gammaproteobacteria bacterium]|nr:hypothetical protein [Gammaproteobacteria bacterium]
MPFNAVLGVFVPALEKRRQLLEIARGFTDGASCDGSGTVVVEFNEAISFTSHAGVSFYNATTTETATGTFTVAESSPSRVLTYSGVTWVTPPAIGDVIEFHYDGFGTYRDEATLGVVTQSYDVGDRSLDGYAEGRNIPWVETSGDIQIVSGTIQQTGASFRRPTLAFDESGYRFEFDVSISTTETSGSGFLIRAANTSNEVRVSVSRQPGSLARLALQPRVGGVTGTASSTGDLTLDLSTPRSVIVTDNGTDVRAWFKDVPDNVCELLAAVLPAVNPKLGMIWQANDIHVFDNFKIFTPSMDLPAQQTAIGNCADWTADGFYRHGSIYSATKDVAATWLTEKQATGVNTLWVKAGTLDVSIGYGDEVEDCWVEQTVVTAGSSELVSVTGNYIGWKAADDLSTGTVYIEQSKARP